MSNIQKIQRAKLYLDMLLCDMDPTTQEFINDSVIQKKEIKEVFEYLSGILKELIQNNGEIIQVSEPIEFNLENINKIEIEISEKPIQINAFVSHINKQIDAKTMKRLGTSKVSNWLIEKGFLTREKVSVVKSINQLKTTDLSESIGIIPVEKIDEKTGEIKNTILFTKQAQEYIIENLELIISNDEEKNFETEKLERKSLSSMKGKLWTVEEEDQLIEEYTIFKLPIQEIAKKHQRNYGGIRARLKKLHLIENVDINNINIIKGGAK